MTEEIKMSDQERPLAESINIIPDVADMPLDLTKDEKLRSAALMLGIRYYTDTIIRDPEYLRLIMQREKKAKNSADPEERALWHLRPASVQGVLYCAQEFEQYLLGKRPGTVVVVDDETGEPLNPQPGSPFRTEEA